MWTELRNWGNAQFSGLKHLSSFLPSIIETSAFCIIHVVPIMPLTLTFILWTHREGISEVQIRLDSEVVRWQQMSKEKGKCLWRMKYLTLSLWYSWKKKFLIYSLTPESSFLWMWPVAPPSGRDSQQGTELAELWKQYYPNLNSVSTEKGVWGGAVLGSTYSKYDLLVWLSCLDSLPALASFR